MSPPDSFSPPLSLRNGEVLDALTPDIHFECVFPSLPRSERYRFIIFVTFIYDCEVTEGAEH